MVNAEAFAIDEAMVDAAKRFNLKKDGIFNWEDFMSGFPNEPHTNLELPYSDYKPYEVRTDNGYSPIECYYKIIKK